MRKGRFPEYHNQSIHWSFLKKLLPYLMEFKWRVVLAIICLIGAKLASVGLPLLLKHIVDHLSGTAQIIALPVSLIVTYGTFRLLNALLGEIRDTLFGRVTERAMRRIGLKVFQHLHALDLSFHLSRETGGLSRDIERGTSGISFLLRFMIFNIVPTILEILLISLILYWQLDIWFGVIILISVILYISFSVITTEWRTRFIKATNEADSKSNTRAIDSLLNYETVKYFNNEDYEAKNYDNHLKEWEQARRKNRLSLFALNVGQALIISLALTAILLLAAHHITENNMSVGDFAMVNAYMMQLFIPLNFLGFVYREIKGAMTNIEQMFLLLQKQPKISDTHDAKDIILEQGGIRFEEVSFSYHDRPILKNISFHVNSGQKIAIVGASGSGKSTIIKLLFRFYESDSGSIYIDNHAIHHLTLSSLRQQIGIVPQDTVLFNTSIWENIRYGNIHASDEAIYSAIEAAYLKNFINELPEGIHTLVGERGLKLSGGEKQRIAIARTILKKPKILLFDEATSSLDSHSEFYVLKAIKQLEKKYTSITIAHRLSTITEADNIIVLDKGCIVEQGTHQQLLKNNRHYATLWNIQLE